VSEGKKLSARPEWSFQDEAVVKVFQDIKRDPFSRNLLVIPTGGGKTIAAIRIVNELLRTGFLSKQKTAIWATHRKQLKEQTIEARDNKKNKKDYNYHKDLSEVLRIEMKDNANKILRSDKQIKFKLLIIDEAHHSAANSYKEFFANKKRGILGLTATPARNDDSKLEFDKISYSITFKELVNRNVLIRPKFLVENTRITVDVDDLKITNNDSQLEKFNSEGRNRFVADTILKHRELFKKVIVFVGTNKHVKDLFEVIRKRNKFYGSPYKHIGFVYADGNNDLDIDNESYLEWHKNQSSSVLVNCRLLNEGYDDPTLDTVVMAVPTKSILYYMQCIGRVVRRKTKDTYGGSCYVLELEDHLPNVNYRIDNRWLFSDISDLLEPQVIDEKCPDNAAFVKRARSILEQHKVDRQYFSKIPTRKNFDENSILLFNAGIDAGEGGKWYPIFLTPENKSHYISIFNQLSNNIKKYHDVNTEYLLFKKLKIPKSDDYFKSRIFRVDLLHALFLALTEITAKKKVERLKYYTFEKIEGYPNEFLEFIKDCHNQVDLMTDYNEKFGKNMTYLIKFPLILGGFEGFYAAKDVYLFFEFFLDKLRYIKKRGRVKEREKLVFNFINSLDKIPLPLKYVESMIYIVKDELKDEAVVLDLSEE